MLTFLEVKNGLEARHRNKLFQQIWTFFLFPRFCVLNHILVILWRLASCDKRWAGRSGKCKQGSQVITKTHSSINCRLPKNSLLLLSSVGFENGEKSRNYVRRLGHRGVQTKQKLISAHKNKCTQLACISLGEFQFFRLFKGVNSCTFFDGMLVIALV